jgi:hypothetical protein
VKRRLFNLLAVVSLLLCLATTALCIRSYWVWDDLTAIGAWRPLWQLHSISLYLPPYARPPTRTPVRIARLEGDAVSIESARGGIQIALEYHDATNPRRTQSRGWRVQWSAYRLGSAPSLAANKDSWWGHLAASADSIGSVNYVSVSYEYYIPDAVLAPVLGVLPAVSLFRRFRRRRRANGLCRVCGYDLRATPDRCPECGAIPETAQTPRPNPSPSSTPPILK